MQQNITNTPNTVYLQAVTTALAIGTLNSNTVTFYANSTQSAQIGTGGAWTFANDATINGLTVGKGGGNVADNTVVGFTALSNNTSGTANSAFGGYALLNNTTGTTNTAIGRSALTTNTTGSSNTSIGYWSLLFNSTGSNNVANGYQALYSNTTASNNTAVGYQAGYSGTTGAGNTFIGIYAGYLNTTGIGNTYVGSREVNNGYSAGNLMTTGSKNTILGNFSGANGGLDIRTASNYIVLSDGDGNPRLYSDGSGKWTFGASTSNFNSSYVFINNASTGNWAQTISDSFSGSQAFVSFNYGSTQIGKITGNNSAVLYLTTSDYRLKENVKQMVGALDKVAKLKPVTYDWKVGGSSEGFIAHELAEVCPDAVNGEKDAVNADGSIKAQGIDTSLLVATLTAAIQEQQAIIAQLQSDVAALKGSK